MSPELLEPSSDVDVVASVVPRVVTRSYRHLKSLHFSFAPTSSAGMVVSHATWTDACKFGFRQCIENQRTATPCSPTARRIPDRYIRSGWYTVGRAAAALGRRSERFLLGVPGSPETHRRRPEPQPRQLDPDTIRVTATLFLLPLPVLQLIPGKDLLPGDRLQDSPAALRGSIRGRRVSCLPDIA
jgi:hypothetical protein